MGQQKNAPVFQAPGMLSSAGKLQHPVFHSSPTRHELAQNEDNRSRAAGVPGDDEGQKQAYLMFDKLLRGCSCSAVSPQLFFYEPMGFCVDRITRASRAPALWTGLTSC